MASYVIDDVDRELLVLIQENSRAPAQDLAESLGVSDTTVHNRLRGLESAGVISGYGATIDPERTGLDLHFLFTCTARIGRRGEMAGEILEIPGVMEVTELMTGHRNLQVKAVGADDEDISRVAAEIDDLDVEIEDENLIKREHARALDFTEVEVAEMIAEEVPEPE